MAAPTEMTMKCLRGYWTMNKVESDPIEAPLALQGIPWIMRKMINMATITMYVEQERNGAGVDIITVEQTATGGIKAETEIRKLDWSIITTVSTIWGTATHQSRWVNIKNVKCLDGNALDPYLTEGWIEDERAGMENAWILDFIENKGAGWSLEQIWGFILVDGKKYHARKTLVRRGDKVAKARTRYDWKGETKI